jgi:hypothetical protein
MVTPTALPQADGHPGDFGGHTGPVMVRKSGPAFDAFEDRPLATDLARSLQAQAAHAIGDVLYALTRYCFTDAMPAWERLLEAMRPTFTPVTLSMRHPDQLNTRTLHAIVLALSSCEGLEAPIRWANADALMRLYARVLADGLDEDMESDECPSPASLTLRAFAEGRAL